MNQKPTKNQTYKKKPLKNRIYVLEDEKKCCEKLSPEYDFAFAQ